MGALQPFSAATERHELTEKEYRKLKTELTDLRAEFVQKTGTGHSNVDLKTLQNIEQKMYSLEHTLAHASITYETVEEARYKGTFKSLLTEIRFSLMGIRLKIQQKLRPQRHGYTHHTITYHLKR